MAEPFIRPIREEDVAQIHEIEKACFAMPWSEESILHDVKENVVARWLVMDDGAGRVLAYAGMWLVLDEAHVCNIAVHPDHRQRGLGNAVLRALLKHAKAAHLGRVTLEVRPSNTAALALYKKNGFAEVGRRRGFYTKPTEDAVIMEIRLK